MLNISVVIIKIWSVLNIVNSKTRSVLIYSNNMADATDEAAYFSNDLVFIIINPVNESAKSRKICRNEENCRKIEIKVTKYTVAGKIPMLDYMHKDLMPGNHRRPKLVRIFLD